MLAYVFFSKDSAHAPEAERFAADLQRRQVEAELIDADSAEGARLTKLYDLMSRPAVALVRQDGTLVEAWQHQLPLSSEVSYYAHL